MTRRHQAALEAKDDLFDRDKVPGLTLVCDFGYNGKVLVVIGIRKNGEIVRPVCR